MPGSAESAVLVRSGPLESDSSGQRHFTISGIRSPTPAIGLESNTAVHIRASAAGPILLGQAAHSEVFWRGSLKTTLGGQRPEAKSPPRVHPEALLGKKKKPPNQSL